MSGKQHAGDCGANSCVALMCLILTRCSVKNVSQHNLKECLNSEIVITVCCWWIYNNETVKMAFVIVSAPVPAADVHCITKTKCQNIEISFASFEMSKIWHLGLQVPETLFV